MSDRISSLVPNKSLGQHWLEDASTLEAICQAAELTPDDTVLEIGPGLGALTKHLVIAASKVVAVEIDPRLTQLLPNRITAANLKIVEADILEFDLTQLPSGYKVVANLPYYLSNQLLRRLSETTNPPRLAAILLQKEVAERVVAQPGRMSLLSVTTQFFWQAELGITVPAVLFTPPPKVDATLLILRRRKHVLFPDVDKSTFFRLVRAGFNQRRKTLINSISAGLHYPKSDIEKACQSAGIDPMRRAQTLTLVEWHKLYKSLTG
jgi:16S rRNA (adenine1518-N6/adenine1519-N6)-dimethyltransferase